MAAVEVTHLRLSSGEHYFVLIDDRGVPVDLPLLYGLSLRRRGGSYLMHNAMLRLKDLYRAFEMLDVDLEKELAAGQLLPADIENALRRLERAEWPLAHDDSGAPSNWMWDERLKEWRRFLRWAVNRSNWAYGARYTRLRRVFDDDNDRIDYFEDYLSELKKPLEEGARADAKRGFPVREIQALEDVFEIRDGEYVRCPFSRATARRNHALFILLRYGGLRRSEALNVGVSDLPPSETADERFFRREVERQALTITVRRRQDDPGDERLDEPRTKRFARTVEMPDATLPVLRGLAESLPTTRHDYLLRSSQTGRPLSMRQCGRIITQIFDAAGEIFEEAWPDDPHSLHVGNAHRFRHHRAIQLLPKFFPHGPKTVNGRERFCDHFGWKDLRSADPYIHLLHLHESERWKAELRSEWFGDEL